MKRKPPPLIAPIAFLENRWLTHGLFWAIVLSLLLGGGYGQSSVSPFFKMTLIEFSGYFIFSYIVLLILVPYFLYSSRFTGFIILSVLLNVVFAYVMYKTNTMALKDIPGIEELNIFTTLPVFVLFFFYGNSHKIGQRPLNCTPRKRNNATTKAATRIEFPTRAIESAFFVEYDEQSIRLVGHQIGQIAELDVAAFRPFALHDL